MTNLEKRLDRAWSQAVKNKPECECCGMVRRLEPHHIFSRVHQGTRWDLNNGIALCVCCHSGSGEFSAHRTPLEFEGWLQGQRGKDWWEELRAKALAVTKFTNEDKQKILKGLRASQ